MSLQNPCHVIEDLFDGTVGYKVFYLSRVDLSFACSMRQR